MELLTQTRPDNCWQTCVAMLVGRPAEELPAQHEFPTREAYVKALRVFLDKHHGKTYVEVHEDSYAKALTQTEYHIMIGDTVRTTPEHDVWHAIVGRRGEAHWDVHPSRDGLTKVRAWGLLVPTPPEWRSTWAGVECGCSVCSRATC